MAQNLVLSERAKLELQELKKTLNIKTDTKCIEYLILNFQDILSQKNQQKEKAHNYFQELQTLKNKTIENLDCLFYGLERLSEMRKNLHSRQKLSE